MILMWIKRSLLLSLVPNIQEVVGSAQKNTSRAENLHAQGVYMDTSRSLTGVYCSSLTVPAIGAALSYSWNNNDNDETVRF